MDNLTDLELEKRIADIEGVNYFITKGESPFVGILSENDFTGTPPELIGKFNPLTDKALLWDLRQKHEVEIDDFCKTCRIWVGGHGDNFATDYDEIDQLPRAMLEVIVEANNG